MHVCIQGSLQYQAGRAQNAGICLRRQPVSRFLVTQAAHSWTPLRSFEPAASTLHRCVSTHASAAAVEVDVTPTSAEPASGVAHLRGVRGTPSKFRRVLDQIRGRTYEEALMLLEYLPYRACEDVLTTLISAASNAKNNAGAAKRNLVIVECFADDAGMYKRFQPRAKGRPFAIQVKKSHVTIRVQEKSEGAGKKKSK